MLERIKKSIFRWRILLLMAVVVSLSLAVLYWYRQSRIKKEEENHRVKEVIYDCCFVPFQPDFEKERLKLYPSTKRSGLMLEGEAYYIQSLDSRVDMEFPAYQNDGATLFFLKDNYQLMLEDLSITSGVEKVYVSCGLAFRQDNQKVQEKTILFLLLSNGYCMNSSTLKIKAASVETVNANAILRFEENQLLAYEYQDGALQRRSITLEEEAICVMGDTSFSYYELYHYVNAVKSNQTEKIKRNQRLKLDGYYYFLGARYTLSGESIFYPIQSGYLIENAGFRYKLGSSPIYLRGEKKLLLPTAYALVQPSQHWMNGLPALTEIRLGDYAVHVTQNGFSKAFNDVFLYDGKENYIVFTESTLRINEFEHTISPFSCITVEEGNKVSVYDYAADEYSFRFTAGSRALLYIFDSITLDLTDQTVIRRDQSKELLFADPSMLPELLPE